MTQMQHAHLIEANAMMFRLALLPENSRKGICGSMHAGSCGGA